MWRTLWCWPRVVSQCCRKQIEIGGGGARLIKEKKVFGNVPSPSPLLGTDTFPAAKHSSRTAMRCDWSFSWLSLVAQQWTANPNGLWKPQVLNHTIFIVPAWPHICNLLKKLKSINLATLIFLVSRCFFLPALIVFIIKELDRDELPAHVELRWFTLSLTFIAQFAYLVF